MRKTRLKAGTHERDLLRFNIRYRIRTGQIVSEPCMICGAQKVWAYISDLRTKASVIWLCPTHHNEMRRSSGRAARYMRSGKRLGRKTVTAHREMPVEHER